MKKKDLQKIVSIPKNNQKEEKKEISHKLLVEKNPLQNKLQKIINYSKKDGVFNVF